MNNKVDKSSVSCGSAISFDNTSNKQPLGPVALGSTNACDNTLSKQDITLNNALNKQGPPHSVEMEVETGFDMAACKNHGQPISVEWDAKSRFFIDGFGLYSPTRWQPWDRAVGRSSEAKSLLASIYSMLLQEVVSAVGDPRRVCFELVLGSLKSSPFSTKTVESCRSAICDLLGVNNSAMEVPQGQPFHLHLVARVLKIVGDPDTAILVDCNDSFATFATGVPVGVEEPLPRTPMVFPPKERHRKLDESDFNPIAENYASAQVSKEELEAKFREEESLGRMFPSKLSVLQAEYGDRLRIASMAAITKPDGTHSVRVNNDIIYRDRIQCPGHPEVAVVVRECAESGEAPFAVAADIKSAHRLVKIRSQEWGYMCCRSDSLSDVVWCNKVGTFGVSSAPYWWSRPFGLIGRFVSYILGTELFYHMVYVDDLSGAFLGDRKFLKPQVLRSAICSLCGISTSIRFVSGGYL